MPIPKAGLVTPRSNLHFPKAALALGTISLLLFTLSAGCGLLVAYAWIVALEKFLALLIGIVMVLLLAWIGSRDYRWIVPIVAMLSVPILVRNVILIFLQPGWLGALAGPLGEAGIILLPLVVGWSATLQHKPSLGRGGVALLLLAALAFIYAREMSAGLALLGGTALFTWLEAQQWLPPARRWLATLGNRLFIAVAIASLLAYTAVLTSPRLNSLFVTWLPAVAATRVQRYHDFLAIVADYPFTGSGLGDSAMIYSTYLFLVHVPFLAQAHNLFLQMAIEQGIPGLVAWVSLLAASVWTLSGVLLQTRGSNGGKRARSLHLLAAATMGALVTLCINGLFDGEIYSSQLVPLVFAPIGAAWGIFFAVRLLPVEELDSCAGWMHHQEPGWMKAAALLPLLVVVAMLFAPQGFAAAYANAGAVAQAKAELSIYSWPTWSLQDQVRRARPEILIPAIRAYEKALVLDGDNVTAHWRLGQIALAQGQYARAEQHLAHAYHVAPGHRATRQLLGELYALQGKLDRAVELWRPLDVSQDQLLIRQWWYEGIGDTARLLKIQEAVYVLEQTTDNPSR